MLNREFILKEFDWDIYFCEETGAFEEIDKLIMELKPYEKKLKNKEYVIFDDDFYNEYIKSKSIRKYKAIKRFYYPIIRGVTLFEIEN